MTDSGILPGRPAPGDQPYPERPTPAQGFTAPARPVPGHAIPNRTVSAYSAYGAPTRSAHAALQVPTSGLPRPRPRRIPGTKREVPAFRTDGPYFTTSSALAPDPYVTAILRAPDDLRTSGKSGGARKGKGGRLGVLRDIGLVSFGKYGQYIITLLTQPLIARQLGPHGVGLLAIGISAYFIGSLLVDLGITSFLAAKVEGATGADIAGLRGTYLTIRGTTLGVMGLALAAGLLAGVGAGPRMILIGLFTGGFWSFGEDWLLIGQGRFGASTLYQGIGRVAYLILLVTVLPRHPTAPVAMACLFTSAIVTVTLTWWDALRTYGLPGRPDRLREVYRLGAPVVASRALVTSYGQGSATVYSSVLDAASLGLYSTGDRLVRAIQSMLDPIGYALLPRMARNHEQDQFWRTSIRFLTAVVTLAALAVISVWITAPLLIHVMFGPQFAGAVPMLRMEVTILPFTAITSFATTAVLSVRQDTVGVLVGAILGTCIAATALGLTATTAHSVWTLVYGTVAAETCVAVWYIIRMRWLALRDKAVRVQEDTGVPWGREGAQS